MMKMMFKKLLIPVLVFMIFALPLLMTSVPAEVPVYGTGLNLPNLSWQVAKESVTYTAGGRGAVGTDTLFTVTGDIVIRSFMGIVNTDLTEGGATSTVKVGTANSIANLISSVNAVDLDDGQVWLDGTPGADIDNRTGIFFFINDGADIIQTVATQTITAGQIDFYVIWAPVETGASVVAAP